MRRRLRLGLFGGKYHLAGILMAVSLVGMWISGITPAGVLAALYRPGLFVFEAFVLTTPWRSVTLRQVARMFFIGAGVVPPVTLGMQRLLYLLVNIPSPQSFFISNSVLGGVDLMAPVVAPISEEFLKALPVVLFILWGRGASWRRITGPLDLAVLGATSGSGFGFVENLFRVAGGDWEELGPVRILPAAGPHLGCFYLFPDMFSDRFYHPYGLAMAWFGHGETAAAVCLAFGFALFMRKRRVIRWLFPGITLLWVIWDHFLANYLSPTPDQAWTYVLPWLDLYGRLLSYFFLASCILAAFLAFRTRRWYLGVDTGATVGSNLRNFLMALRATPRSIPGLLLAWYDLRRRQLAVAYGFRDFQASGPESVNWAAWLACLRKEMLESKRCLIAHTANNSKK